MKGLLFVGAMLIVSCLAYGQYPIRENNHEWIASKLLVGADTVIQVDMPEMVVFGKYRFKNQREAAKYDRLVYNVKKTLPYARIASSKLREVNTHLASLQTDEERKEYLKKTEKDLFAEFEKPLKKMTFSQGRILINLVDRETGDTGYNLVKEYKGTVSAFFWQSVARLFGANLKDEYDAEGEDSAIESIVVQIDMGLL
jgi:hypothetical protein